MISRRFFLRDLAMGSAAASVGIPLANSGAYATKVSAGKSTVSFVSGTNRRQMIIDVLEPLKQTIEQGIAGRQIIIKPNMVYPGNPLCATHPDAVRGLLDVLETITDQKIIIAESSATNAVMSCFQEYGYSTLARDYNIELQDLNEYQTVSIDNLEQLGERNISLKVAGPLFDSNNYVISICRPKTHNCVVATMTLKNFLMAAPHLSSIDNQKMLVHSSDYSPQASPVLTNNLFTIANHGLPSLAVVDGYEGMQGDGPIGSPSLGDRASAVQHRIALAGTDPVAVDSVGFRLMGIEPKHTYYAMMCGNAGLGNYHESSIEVLGPDIAEHVIEYEMHRSFEEQIAWIVELPVDSRARPVRNVKPFLHVKRNGLVFNSSVHIDFNLPNSGVTRLSVRNLKGQAVRKFVSGWMENGKYSIEWDGRDDYGTRVSSGPYLLHLFTETGIAHTSLRVLR